MVKLITPTLHKITILILIGCLSLITARPVSAQADSTNFAGRANIMLQFWGPELLGVHVNVYLSNRFSLNFGLGFNADFHGGGNYYFSPRNRSSSSFFFGAQFNSIREIQFNIFGGNPPPPERQFGFYIPIGFERVARKNFTFQADVGPNFVMQNWNQANTMGLMASLKIGLTTVRPSPIR